MKPRELSPFLSFTEQVIVVGFEPKNKSPYSFFCPGACSAQASERPSHNKPHSAARSPGAHAKGQGVQLCWRVTWGLEGFPALPDAVLPCNSRGPKDTGRLTLGICERIYYFYTIMPFLPHLPGIYLTLEKTERAS